MHSIYIATGQSFARLTSASEGEDSREWQVETSLTNKAVRCLAVSQAFEPAQHAQILAGTQGQGLWHSDDLGASWTDLNLPHDDVFSVAISPANGAYYAGCEPSMIFRSDDGGASWRELSSLRDLPSQPTWSFPPRPWTSHVRWIAPNPTDSDLLLAGIELGGVMISDDGGVTWHDHRPGAQRDVHALAWHPTELGRAYEAGGGGAAWSFDHGWTWQAADAGRDRHYTWALAVDSTDPDCWFISASTGPRAAHSGADGGGYRAEAKLYRWRGEGPWQELDGGLPKPLDVMPYALSTTPGVLYAGLKDGAIYASRDGGDSWHKQMLHDAQLPGIEAMIAWP